ncbi:MAG: immunoglobulin domain-containing protein, partial [Oscillospiraceae bacterium]|nr:immunoglobulin domain-containing protein [Oscillospiraceae bacterium]
MSKLRKTLALLLCLAVCLTLMPAAFAEEPAGDYLVWEDAPVANESAPVITAQPASISVTEGATASFTVKASGTNLKYQWKFYAAGTAVPQNAASTTATLKFTATEAQNGYAYFCEIKNGGGTVTTDYAFLTVSAGSGTVTRPSITTQPKSVTAADGTQT